MTDTNRNGFDEINYASNDLYSNYINASKNRIITMDADVVDNLNVQDMKKLVQEHQKLIPFYESMENMYRGLHPIFFKRSKTDGKPDIRIAVNFAKYLVDTSSSYFNGKEMHFTSKDPNVQEWLDDYRKENNENDLDNELAKNTAIYGHAYKYLYQDENAQTKVALVKPTDGFVVYSDDVRRLPLLAVVYEHIDDDSFKCGVFSYNDSNKLIFIKDGNNYRLDEKDNQTEKIDNPYDGLPLIEFTENDERQGRIEPVVSLINAYNQAISEKANDVESFADAYLKLIGIDLNDKETLKQMRDNRILWSPNGYNSENKPDIDFLQKPNADTTQENLLTRLERLIYKISMVFNTNDESFSGNISGEALKLKLRDMDSVAETKARKFESSFLEEYQKVMAVETNGIANKSELWKTIVIQPDFNQPHNISTEADVMVKLEGLVSKETQLRIFSPTADDPKGEMERMKKEEQEDESSEPTINTGTDQAGQDNQLPIENNQTNDTNKQNNNK